MTAVEWLVDQLIKYELIDNTINPNNVLFHKAKVMEHDLLTRAIEYGYQLRNNHRPINSGIDWVKEFKETYKHD